jgi:hypothetical protein
MSKRKVAAKRGKSRLSIEPLEPRRLLDVTGIWQELGFRSASGGGITSNPYFLHDYHTDMGIDPQGRPIIVNVQDGALVAQTYNGFRWTQVGDWISGPYPSAFHDDDPAIALDYRGVPYVAYLHREDGIPTTEIYLKYFDTTTGTWKPLGGSDSGEGISNDGTNNAKPAIAIAPNGQPIVAYEAYDQTGNDYEIVVKQYDGNRWVELTNGLEFGKTQGTMSSLYGGGVSDDTFDSRSPRLAVDKSGYPIVVWQSTAFANNSEIYVRRWNGSEWREVGLDSASGPVGKYGDPDTHASFGISKAWWTEPSTTSAVLNAVWGSSGNDVFAVGDGGAVVHYTGTAWVPMTSGTTANLGGVWGGKTSLGVQHVYVVGDGGTILHYSPASGWTSMTSGTTANLSAAWGSGVNDVYAVGDGGTIVHYDGTAWSSVSSGTTANLRGVWGSGTQSLIVVGDAGTMRSYNGATWSTVVTGTTNNLAAVWGSSVKDIFAVGAGGTILHYNGTELVSMTSPTTNALSGIWGSGPKDAFTADNLGTIYHYNGSAWSKMSEPTGTAVKGVWGTGSSNAFVVGAAGSIRHYQSDATMSTEPIVKVTRDNTIIVAWIDYQDYQAKTNVGIYVKEFKGGWDPDAHLWEEYSPGSAGGRGIIGSIPDWNGLTFTDISMDVGPHSDDIVDGKQDYDDTPAITWNSTFGGDEAFLIRYNPLPNPNNNNEPYGWQYLVGDGEDITVTNSPDGPTPPSAYPDPAWLGSTPDVTGYRKTSASWPIVGINQSTGREVLTYTHVPTAPTYFPDEEIYVQQYSSTSNYYEIRDLDETQNVTISATWSFPGALALSLLDSNGLVTNQAVGQIGPIKPEAYVDPQTGQTRGLVRVLIQGQTWGQRDYTLTISQGGRTQNVESSSQLSEQLKGLKANETFLDRQVIPNDSPAVPPYTVKEARTVQVHGTLNNEWTELGRGSMSPGGLDNSFTTSTPPKTATAADGSEIMAWIDSNQRWYDDPAARTAVNSWLSVKVFDQQVFDLGGQTGAWIDLAGPPLQSEVINGALTMQSVFIPNPTLGDPTRTTPYIDLVDPTHYSNLSPVVKPMAISSDPWIINDLHGSIFLAVTDGQYIEVYETTATQNLATNEWTYGGWQRIAGNPAAADPAEQATDVWPERPTSDTTGQIVWVSVQSGPGGEAALAWEWYDPNGHAARNDPSPANWPAIGAGDVYVKLWHYNETTGKYQWDDMGRNDDVGANDWSRFTWHGTATTPDAYGVGGFTNTGFGRWPDLAFVPTQSSQPGIPPGSDKNVGGSYVLAYADGDGELGGWFRSTGTDAHYYTGFESLGIYAEWFDKNTGQWGRPWILGLTYDGRTAVDPVVPEFGAPGQYWLARGDYPTIASGYPKLYNAQRMYPSITIGQGGRPFVSWTLELYDPTPPADGGVYNYRGSWIEGYQWDPDRYGYTYVVDHWFPLVGHEHWIGSSVSAANDEEARADGAERVDDVLMSKAVGNAGQLPYVTWQSLDVDNSATTPDPPVTYIPATRTRVPGKDGEDTIYDTVRPYTESGWIPGLGGPEELNEIHARRYYADRGTWEQINSRSDVMVGWSVGGYTFNGTFPSTAAASAASGSGLYGVDQWWSSGYWPDMALVTNPGSGNTINDPFIGWLNDSEQTVYVRRWNNEANTPHLVLLENSGTKNDDHLAFQQIHIAPSADKLQWIPVTLSNTGSTDLTILDIRMNSPFVYRLAPDWDGQRPPNTAPIDTQRKLQMHQGGIVLGRGQSIVFEVAFNPGLNQAGQWYETMDIVTTDLDRPIYPVLLTGLAWNGAVIQINEKQGVENDMVIPFGFVEPGSSKSLTFTITNTSKTGDVLNVSRIFAGLPDLFQINAPTLSLLAGQSMDVTLTFKPQSDLPVFDTLAIYSNDLVNPRLFLKLTGNARGLADPTPTPPTLGPGNEVTPSIGAGFIAYIRGGDTSPDAETDGDIYIFDRLAGSELTSPIPVKGHNPQVWDDWVIFSGGLYDITNAKLYPFAGMPLSYSYTDDLGNTKTVNLTISSVSHVSADGSRFAFSGNTSAGQGIYVVQINRDLLRTNGSWGTDVGPGSVVEAVYPVPKITSGATDDYPALDGDWIAWREAPTNSTREATDKNVYLYQYISSNPLFPPSAPRQLTPVAGAAGYMIPHFANDRVVWMDDRWGAALPQIFMYDINDQKSYELTESFSQKAQNFAFNGSLVVWADQRSGNWDLYAFDVERWKRDPYAANEIQLTFDNPDPLATKYNQVNPSLDGGWIAYQDDRPIRQTDGTLPPKHWEVWYSIFLDRPEIGVRELSGKPNDSVLEFGGVNLDTTKGVGFEIRNVGYDPLVVSGYQLNNLGVYNGQFKVYRYVDANNNLRLDPDEAASMQEWLPGEALDPLKVGERQSVWLEWTPTVTGELKYTQGGATNPSIRFFSNSKTYTTGYDVYVTGRAEVAPDIVVTPTVVDLGSIPLGTAISTTVTITNVGNAALTITGIQSMLSPPFVVLNPPSGYPFTIAKGQSATFDVFFAPPSAVRYPGEIRIYNDDPDYAATGGYYSLSIVGSASLAPDIAVNDAQGNKLTTLAFGPVELGKYKDTIVAVSNQGGAPLRLTGLVSTVPTEIYLVGSLPTTPIAPGQTVNLLVRFKPTRNADYSTATFKLLSNDPDVTGNAWNAPVENPYTLAVTGQGIIRPHLVVEETTGVPFDGTVDFGIVTPSAGQVDRTFTIKNAGSDVLEITSWDLTPSGSPFQVLSLPTTSFFLDPGDTRTVTVRFVPGAQGDYSATLKLYSNDTDYSAGYTVGLAAKVRSGRVVVTPNAFSFGDVEIYDPNRPVAQTFPSRSFTITNSGSAPIQLTSVEASDPAFIITPPADPRFAGAFTLAPNETTPAFTVTFRPTAVKTYDGAVVVRSDDPSAPVQEVATLHGRGVVLPSLTVLESSGTPNDAAIDCGSVQVGQSSSPQTITLRNDGSGPLTLISWGVDNSGYSLSSQEAYPKVLQPGEGLNITVTFTPPTATTYPGAITIVSDDPSKSPFVVRLAGTGTPAPVAGDFNGNGQLDPSDFELFKGAFGSKNGDSNYNVKFDLDLDNDVDYGDLGIFLGYYGQASRAPGKEIVASAAAPASLPDFGAAAVQPVADAGVQVGDNAKAAVSAQSARSADRSGEVRTLFDSLGIALEMGAIPDAGAAAAIASDLASAGGSVGTAGIQVGSASIALPAAAVQAVAIEQSAPPAVSRWTTFAAAEPQDLLASRLGLDELTRLDPLVVPYAGALLPLGEM